MRVAFVLLAGCATEPALSVDTVEVKLPVGAVIERDRFTDPDQDGRADNFSDLVHESGKATRVRYAVDDNHDQRISVTLASCPPAPGPCGFGTNGDGRASLIEVTRDASPGDFYKGWMAARTVDSNNNGNGLCEDDSRFSPGREQFRAQLKIWFMKETGDDIVASCYCNVCPAEGGAPTFSKCNTAQWAINTTLSDDGACRAPAGTKRVRFAITALARDRQPVIDGDLLGPEASGTAVFDRYVFTRCGADGFCDDPKVTDATRWY